MKKAHIEFRSENMIEINNAYDKKNRVEGQFYMYFQVKYSKINTLFRFMLTYSIQI